MGISVMAANSNHNQILLTGGSGKLGSVILKQYPDVLAPSSKEFDVSDFTSLREFCKNMENGSTTLVHAAAYTFTRLETADPMRALEVNIIGTSNIVKLCIEKKWKLVYISTDYVFRGDRGGYKEEDEVYPFNEYAWTKLGGECAARLYSNSLIVRATFGPKPFPFSQAFSDQWTSKVDVEILANAIIRVAHSHLTGIIHIGTPRRTILDYARSVSPGKCIGESSRQDSPVSYPFDTSLDCKKYTEMFGQLVSRKEE